MKSPKAERAVANNTVEDQTVKYKITLLKEIHGAADDEGQREIDEYGNLLENEEVELDELKAIIRDRGISEPSSSSAQAGLSFFSGVDNENRRAFENDEITHYHLWIYEKDGKPLTSIQLAREARALGIPFARQGVDEQTYDKIKELFARTLYVSVLADQAEEVGYPGITGADWFNLAQDETPAAAVRAADYLIRRLELDNDCDVVTLFQRALEANPELERDEAIEKFGFYIPMQSIGSGLSWTDNYESFLMGFPFYFSGSDLISIGQEDIRKLPLFDSMDVDESAMADLPEKTSWAFRDDYEPPLERRQPMMQDGPSL